MLLSVGVWFHNQYCPDIPKLQEVPRQKGSQTACPKPQCDGDPQKCACLPFPTVCIIVSADSAALIDRIACSWSIRSSLVCGVGLQGAHPVHAPVIVPIPEYRQRVFATEKLDSDLQAVGTLPSLVCQLQRREHTDQTYGDHWLLLPNCYALL